jgi:hypothetical protein
MLRFSWFALLTLVLGCSDKESGGDAAPAGRGSDACNEWQGAVCDWLARCGGSDEQVTTCRRQAAGITCKSDEQAGSCAAELSSNACSSPPVSCDLRDLAAPTAATAACDQFADAACSAGERCGQSKAECLADPKVADLCTGVIGHTLAFEQCLQELDALSCSAETTPEICKGVIVKS